jgi:hypothetical protein
MWWWRFGRSPRFLGGTASARIRVRAYGRAPNIECISAAPLLPAVKRRDQRKSWHVANHGPRDCGRDHHDQSCSRHQRSSGVATPEEPRKQCRDSGEQEHVVDDGCRQIGMQQIMGHSQATAGRAVPAREQFERALREQRAAVVWVDNAHVGDSARSRSTGCQCGVGLSPSREYGAGMGHTLSMPPTSRRTAPGNLSGYRSVAQPQLAS